MPATGSVQLDVKVVPVAYQAPGAPGEDDARTLIAWMYEGAHELANAHLTLDAAGVPRENPESGNPFTLAARIHHALANQGKAGIVTTVSVNLDSELIAESISQALRAGTGQTA
jgi:hypothetical protein